MHALTEFANTCCNHAGKLHPHWGVANTQRSCMHGGSCIHSGCNCTVAACVQVQWFRKAANMQRGCVHSGRNHPRRPNTFRGVAHTQAAISERQNTLREIALKQRSCTHWMSCPQLVCCHPERVHTFKPVVNAKRNSDHSRSMQIHGETMKTHSCLLETNPKRLEIIQRWWNENNTEQLVYSPQRFIPFIPSISHILFLIKGLGGFGPTRPMGLV